MPTPSTSLSTAVVGTVTVSGTVTADQGAAGSSWPVSGPLTDTQLRASPVSVSGTVTANQGTAGSAWPVDASGATVPVSGSVAVTGVAGTVTVDGSGVTQPISAASLPLPDGAATEATLDRIDGAAQDIGLTAILEREKLAP